jgi:hypothetical protein
MEPRVNHGRVRSTGAVPDSSPESWRYLPQFDTLNGVVEADPFQTLLAWWA